MCPFPFRLLHLLHPNPCHWNGTQCQYRSHIMLQLDAIILFSSILLILVCRHRICTLVMFHTDHCFVRHFLSFKVMLALLRWSFTILCWCHWEMESMSIVGCISHCFLLHNQSLMPSPGVNSTAIILHSIKGSLCGILWFASSFRYDSFTRWHKDQGWVSFSELYLVLTMSYNWYLYS